MMRRYAGIGLLIVGCAAALTYQARRRWAPGPGCPATHPGEFRRGSPPIARTPASGRHRVEGAGRLPDRRGDPGPPEHPRAPTAVLHPVAVSALPPAHRLPALALGPPVVRRIGWTLSCRVRRPGANHVGSRRSHQLRRGCRLRSPMVRLRGLEILERAQCTPVADP